LLLFVPPKERCDQAFASADFLALKVDQMLVVLSLWFLGGLIRGFNQSQPCIRTGLLVLDLTLFCR
jgi:hypothetical protein